MAASLRVRDQVLLSSQLQTTQESVASATNPAVAYQRRLFEGAFLDTRATAVVGAFFVVGAYGFAVLMAKVPKAKIGAIFGIIVMDIMCTYAPLFPFGRYTLATIFMLPIGCSLGVSFGCMLFVFPESLNYAWTRSAITMLKLQQGLIAMHGDFLDDTGAVENVKKLEAFDAKLTAANGGLVTLAQALAGQAPFLELDASRGRFSGTDLKRFLPTLRALNIRLLGLAGFVHLLEAITEPGSYVDQPVFDAAKPEDETDGKTNDKTDAEAWRDLKRVVHLQPSYTVARATERQHAAEIEQQVQLTSLQEMMARTAKPTLKACSEAVGVLAAWLERTNESRSLWNRQTDAQTEQSHLDQIRDARDALEKARRTFLDHERLELIRPYEKHFNVDRNGTFFLDQAGANAFRLGGRPLYACLHWVVAFSVYSEQLVKVMSEFHDLAAKRSHHRIWLPSGVRKIGKIFISKKASIGGPLNVNSGLVNQHVGEEADTDDDDDHSSDAMTANEVASSRPASNTASVAEKNEDEPESKREARQSRRMRRMGRHDPDAMPASNVLHHFGRAVVATYDFVTSDVGIFALRIAVVSFALWIPQVLPSSVNFAYQQRAVWALIMAQLGVTVFTGEQVFSTVMRIGGTILGGLIGCVMWYISAGNGTGNAYGYGAVGGVAFVPLVFLRLYAPPVLLLPAIMTCVTALLVYGYSWLDGHLFVLANSGQGIDVFWRRTLLVVIGFAAATAVLFVGRPASTRGLVRRTAASLTSDLLEIYTRVIENFIRVDNDMLSDNSGTKVVDEETEAKKQTKFQESFRPAFIAVYEKLSSQTSNIGLASVDLAPRGRWPKERYLQMQKCHARMLESLGQLAAAHFAIDRDWHKHLLRSTSLISPGVIADISMTLSLVSQALLTGEPLPHSTAGGLLDRTLTAGVQSRRLAAALGQDRLAGSLSLDALRDPEFMNFASAQMAILQFVRACDDLSAIVAALVGERELSGYDALLARVENEIWSVGKTA